MYNQLGKSPDIHVARQHSSKKKEKKKRKEKKNEKEKKNVLCLSLSSALSSYLELVQ